MLLVRYQSFEPVLFFSVSTIVKRHRQLTVVFKVAIILSDTFRTDISFPSFVSHFCKARGVEQGPLFSQPKMNYNYLRAHGKEDYP